MRQFAGLLTAFVLLPIMIKYFPVLFKRKAPLGPILFFSGLIIGTVGGIGPSAMLKAFTDIFIVFSTLQTLIVVVEIGVLGSILKQYGILQRIVSALERLIPSKKALVMILPGIMGLLPVPGGAFLSAPFVDSIGSDLEMSGETKSVVNLYFRHFAMFVLPYNTTFLAISNMLPQVNIYTLIGLNLGFIAFLLLGAYFFYVRKAPSKNASSNGSRGTALKEVALYLSPIYMALVFNTAFGLQMYQALLLCILLTFFLIGKDKSMYLKSAVRGIGIDTVLMLIGVYYIQNTVKSLSFVMASVEGALTGDSIFTFMLVIPVVGLAFGLSTGVSLVPLGILLPFVAGMDLPVMTITVYAFYVLVWSFLGYFFSPFHMCQLLTIKYMGCDTSKVYRLHLKMVPVLACGAVALFLVYSTVFA